MFHDVELYYEPIIKCEQCVGKDMYFSEMNIEEQAFLCGLIKKKKPHNILEIGVAAGGTTSVILMCLNLLGLNSKYTSVDKSEQYYKDNRFNTGFVVDSIKNKISKDIYHRLILGQGIPFVINSFEEKIDFLILDTTHVIPGELLDFLVVLPYLSLDATVVLHDVMYNLECFVPRGISTKVLFGLVSTKKFYMGYDNSKLENIAAFDVNTDFHEYVDELFWGLTFSFSFFEDKDLYYKVLTELYPEKNKFLDRIFNMQQKNQSFEIVKKHYDKDIQVLSLSWKNSKYVYLYGAGNIARAYRDFALLNNFRIDGCVVTEKSGIIDIDLPVFSIDEIDFDEGTSIVLALSSQYFSEVIAKLQNKKCVII